MTATEHNAAPQLSCRYAGKRLFPTNELAHEGAQRIRAKVEAEGRAYQTLYPYRCPDDREHWHLSHYRQGYATCPDCHDRAEAWDGGARWIMAAHRAGGAPCTGQGKPGTDGGEDQAPPNGDHNPTRKTDCAKLCGAPGCASWGCLS